MKVSVVGLGYIGLPTATMFASRGVEVVGIDVSQEVVETINKGLIHIVEPGLDALVQSAVSSGYLRAALAPERADAFLIAVPTPFKGNHEPDLAYVEAATRSIAQVLEQGNVVILESTSPVGTTEKLIKWLSEERPDLVFPVPGGGDCDVNVAYCPERVLPGKVVQELVTNARIVGGITNACAEKACEIYRHFVEGELLVSDARTAEMCKLTENAFRDVNIAFANELSLICDKLGIDVWKLIELSNHHPRVNILRPGAGVGGHCIAVDPWFIVDSAPEVARIIRAAREVNDGKPEWVVEKIESALRHSGPRTDEKGKKCVALLGVAFKPDIDDLRESPALHIAHRFVARDDLEVLIVEPNVHKLPEKLQRGHLVDMDTAVQRADVIAVLVAHAPFIASREELSRFGNLIDAAGVCK